MIIFCLKSRTAHQVYRGAEHHRPLILRDLVQHEEEGERGREDHQGIGQDVEGEGGCPP